MRSGRVKMWLADLIPSKRLFHFKTKDMKAVLDSPEWKKMELEIAIKYCDYPNHNCIKIKELRCEDCGIYNQKDTVEGY
jgi:hypothetical protein